MKDHKPQTSNKQRQRKVGWVVSTQMISTVVVSVDSFVNHPLYKKKIRKTKRFLVHDPQNQAKLGDMVTIEETRPISKLKRWVIIDIKQGKDMANSVDELEEDIQVLEEKDKS